MNYYSYDKFTGAFIGEFPAEKDIEESKVQGADVYLLPAYSTWNRPDECAEDQIQVFNFQSKLWEIKSKERKFIVNDKLVIVKFYDTTDVSEWEEYTEERWSEVELKLAKANKIFQLKFNRDQFLSSNITSQALEFVQQPDGSFAESSQCSFKFRTAETGNPSTNPSAMLLSLILKNSINLALMQPMAYLRYSCEIVNGDSTRKGYVKLSANVASSLVTAIETRTLNAIKIANDKEKLIQDCTNLQDLNYIDITF